MAKETDMTGHNSGELTPAESKALYMHHFRSILAQHEVVLSTRAEEKRLRKLAKADGLVLGDIDFGIRCATIDDPGVVVEELIRHSEIATFFALPVNTQTGFDFEREPAIDKAKREGAADGYAGRDRTSAPHAPDSKAGQAKLKAYDAAQAQMRSDLEAALQKTNAMRDADAAAAGNGADEGPETDFSDVDEAEGATKQ